MEKCLVLHRICKTVPALQHIPNTNLRPSYKIFFTRGRQYISVWENSCEYPTENTQRSNPRYLAKHLHAYVEEPQAKHSVPYIHTVHHQTGVTRFDMSLFIKYIKWCICVYIGRLLYLAVTFLQIAQVKSSYGCLSWVGKSNLLTCCAECYVVLHCTAIYWEFVLYILLATYHSRVAFYHHYKLTWYHSQQMNDNRNLYTFLMTTIVPPSVNSQQTEKDLRSQYSCAN